MRIRSRESGLMVLVLLWMSVCAMVAQGDGQGAAARAPLVLPMETVGGHFIVELQDHLLGKLRLIVDTGAEKTILTSHAAATAKMDRHFTDRFYSFYGFGQGNKAKLKGHTKLQLDAAESTLTTIDAFVVDSGVFNLGLQPAPDGILGWDFFQHLCVRIDPKRQYMTIGAADHCAPAEKGFYAPPVQWLKQGMLIPLTVTLTNGHVLKLNLHLDTGSDSIVLSPRLRRDLGLEKNPQGKSEYQGTGMNGSYPWDLVNAASVVAESGHPGISGNIPIMVPRPGGFSQPNWLFDGKNEALMFHDGVVGTSMLGRFEMIFDPVQKKLYTRVDDYVAK